MGIIRKLYA